MKEVYEKLVENLEGSRFNSYAWQTLYQYSGWGFSLYSRMNEEDEFISALEKTNQQTLNRGKLALSYENEKDLTFSRFVRKLVEKCNCEQEITVVRSDTGILELRESSFGNIQLQ